MTRLLPLLLAASALVGCATAEERVARADGCPAGTWGWWSGSLEGCSWNRLIKEDRARNY